MILSLTFKYTGARTTSAIRRAACACRYWAWREKARRVDGIFVYDSRVMWQGKEIKKTRLTFLWTNWVLFYCWWSFWCNIYFFLWCRSLSYSIVRWSLLFLIITIFNALFLIITIFNALFLIITIFNHLFFTVTQFYYSTSLQYF